MKTVTQNTANGVGAAAGSEPVRASTEPATPPFSPHAMEGAVLFPADGLKPEDVEGIPLFTRNVPQLAPAMRWLQEHPDVHAGMEQREMRQGNAVRQLRPSDGAR